jgi:hypothetical protein
MFTPASLGQAMHLTPYSPGGVLSGVGVLTGWAITNTWGVANKAVYLPLRVMQPGLAKTLNWIAGDVVSGNYDVGLYDVTGKRLAASGSIAVPGASTVVTYDMPDLTLDNQIVYFALVLSSATCRYYGRTITNRSQEFRACGFLEQASALPLPDPAVFAALSTNPPLPDVWIRMAGGA